MATNVLSALERFGTLQRGYYGLEWWYDQEAQSYYVDELDSTVTVMEAVSSTNIDSYGTAWGGEPAWIVVAVAGKCDCAGPTYYKITGYSDSYGGANFTNPTIAVVEKKTEVRSRYE